MKKVLATLMVMFAVITANAQDMYLGGGIGYGQTQILITRTFTLLRISDMD